MRIPFIKSINSNTEVEQVAQLLDTIPRSLISNSLWSALESNCETHFAIAHSGDSISVKFYVKEDIIKVNTHQTNGRVHKDNCVEFFVSFGAQRKYYNIELNCTGICLIGVGEGRLNRVLLDEKLIEKVKTHIKIVSAPKNSLTKYFWEITAIIPIEVFEAHQLKSFHQLKAAGNFFKCGDDLPQPHFYSWNKIESTKINFHLPQFFGELSFD